MLKGLWIVDHAGPCLYKLVIDNRFLEIDENLLCGFFTALSAFANSIGSEEIERLVFKDTAFSFTKKPNAVLVGASDKESDLAPLLLSVSQLYDEVFQRTEKPLFNPLIPSDLNEINQMIDPRIRRIVDTTIVALPKKPQMPEITEKPEIVRGNMIPRMQKSLTDILRRASRERQTLVKTFGMIAVDILHYVNGRRTVEEIVKESGVERGKAEEILEAAEKLGAIGYQ